MKIQIQAPFSVNPYLEEVINKQIGKLTTFNKRLLHANVFLKMKDHTPPNDKAVEVIIRQPGPDLFAESNEATFEKAVAGCADKLRRQLERGKRG